MLDQLTRELGLSNQDGRYIQDYGCQEQKFLNQAAGDGVEVYISSATEGGNPLLHDQVKNIKFDSLFYNRKIQRGCVQLHYPYG